MTARKWHRLHERNLVHKRDMEPVHGGLPLEALEPGKPRRRKLTKEELRRQAEEALANYSGTITKCPTRKRNV